MKRISRAYAAAEILKECPGCEKGRVAVAIDGEEYRVGCPLISRRCQYGQHLHEKLDAHALAGVKALPGLPLRFHERLGEPKPTAAIRGVNMWTYDRQCFLVLHGEHGTGKSFAAAYALYVLTRQKLLPHWKHPTSWGAPAAMWVSAYRVTTKDELSDAARAVPMLVLDDLGSETGSSWVRSKIADIASERYNQKRATILTMNDDALELSKLYGQRMSDRVLGAGHTVYCGGESLRLSA